MKRTPTQSLQQKTNRSEYNTKSKSVLEYAFNEDLMKEYNKHMEDDFFCKDDLLEDENCGFFGVLDGHNGPEVSNYCAKSIPETLAKLYLDYSDDVEKLYQIVANKIDDQLKMIGADYIGAATSFCLIKSFEEYKIAHIGNIGNTKGLLITDDNYEKITVEHRATDPQEKLRVEEVGGEIVQNKVSGLLPITRTLGDLQLKPEVLINIPYYRKIEIREDVRFIVLATEGLWDFVNERDAFEIVKNSHTAEEASKSLIDLAKERNSSKNASVLVLRFK